MQLYHPTTSWVIWYSMQACRGGKFDYGVDTETTDGPTPADTDDDTVLAVQ